MPLTDRFRSALSLAHELHLGQFRKGSTTPYIAHPLSVCGLVLESGGTEDESIAALLHDAVEDSGGLKTLQRIREEFGERVSEIIWECTDTVETPKPAWKPRKEAFLARLATVSRSGALVNCCDKIHNLRSSIADLAQLGPSFWDRFTGGRDGTLWYYRQFCEVIQLRDLNPRLVQELKRLITDLDRGANSV